MSIRIFWVLVMLVKFFSHSNFAFYCLDLVFFKFYLIDLFECIVIISRYYFFAEGFLAL